MYVCMYMCLDLAESVLFVKYRRHENVLSIFADDSCPRLGLIPAHTYMHIHDIHNI